MKTVSLIRHAKSSWKHHNLDDYDRPLSSRGKRDITLMGEWLHKTGFQPSIFISSPANRALTTAISIARHLDYEESHIRLFSQIYDGDEGSIETILKSMDNNVVHAALFGHNPEINILVNKMPNVSIDNVPTLGIVNISFAIKKWHSLRFDEGLLNYFKYPKCIV